MSTKGQAVRSLEIGLARSKKARRCHPKSDRQLKMKLLVQKGFTVLRHNKKFTALAATQYLVNPVYLVQPPTICGLLIRAKIGDLDGGVN